MRRPRHTYRPACAHCTEEAPSPVGIPVVAGNPPGQQLLERPPTRLAALALVVALGRRWPAARPEAARQLDPACG